MLLNLIWETLKCIFLLSLLPGFCLNGEYFLVLIYLYYAKLLSNPKLFKYWTKSERSAFYLWLYSWTGDQPWQTDASPDRKVPCQLQWKSTASHPVLGPDHSAYWDTIQHSHRTVVEAGTQTAFEDTIAETGTQTTATTVINLVVKKKKWTRQPMHLYHLPLYMFKEVLDFGAFSWIFFFG